MDKFNYDFGRQLGKTYRSADEAFKTADYATGIWKCETEWDRTKNFFQDWMGWILVLAIVIIFMFPAIQLVVERNF
jgi:hypothetical protein